MEHVVIHITNTIALDVKRRVIDLGGRRVTGDQVLVVVSRADRSQIKNSKRARARHERDGD